MATGSVDQMYYQGRHCEGWAEERRPIIIQQGKNTGDKRSFHQHFIFSALTAIVCLTCLGSFDIVGFPESKSQAAKTGEMPTYVNTQQIDAQVLAALQAEAENVMKGMAATTKDSPQMDLFDMSKMWE